MIVEWKHCSHGKTLCEQKRYCYEFTRKANIRSALKAAKTWSLFTSQKQTRFCQSSQIISPRKLSGHIKLDQQPRQIIRLCLKNSNSISQVTSDWQLWQVTGRDNWSAGTDEQKLTDKTSRPQRHGSTPKGTPQIWAGIGVRCGKIGSGHTKPAISPKRLKIERKLLLTAYLKLYSVHGLSIAAKMYDLEWPLSEIQDHWFLKCCKNNKI